MAKLSSAAWIVHDVGLAASLGGTLFGRLAMQPALAQIRDAREHDLVATVAWRRFSWLNLAAHGAFAATWVVGRTMLSGREVSRTARTLTCAKDALVGASLATGVASVLLGRLLGVRGERGLGPAQQRTYEGDGHRGAEASRTHQIQRAVGLLGLLNLAANTAIIGVTQALAMEGNKSMKFSALSRWLP